MEGEKNPKKRPLDLDWNEVIPSQDDDDDDEPPQIVILKTEPPPPPPKSSEMSGVDQAAQREEYERLTDRELEERIQRQKKNIQQFKTTLPDKGAKLHETIKRLEEERERRKLRRVTMDVDECEKPTQTTTSGINDTFNGFRRETASSQGVPESKFTRFLNKKLEENQTDCKVVGAFDKELSTLNRCDRHKRYNGEFSQKVRQKGRSSSRQRQFQGPSSRSSNGDKNVLSNGDQKGRTRSIYSLRDTEPSLSSCTAEKKDAFQVPTLHDSRRRKGQTVVLVDEDDEPELLETTEPATEQLNKLAECLKEAKIYYPSRDDPESVEICYKDIDCLAPEAYLRSPVMNFYIRYIQQQATPTNREECDYHFFSTYFYKKLKQAVSYKGSDKDTYFVKFRRWWKGVNIFQKAYVLIPIHEDLHWSLVIICIPDKEEESGPIILHLDSLGLHCSKSVFNNIRSYIREEWNYLNQEVAPSDLPIADKVWKQLSRRIDEKTIAVPQQKNDYDCGLFVLYFMERFIEEAPERLKKKDLAMFGKQWFKPEEASGLRVKIRNILMEEFQIACISESSPLSSGGAPA